MNSLDYYFGRLDGCMKRGRDVLTSDFAYSEDPVTTLVREALQNVSGARQEKTARVEIELMQLPTSNVPKHERLSHLLEMCAAALSGAGADKDAVPFRSVAHRLIAANSISALRISDYGTTGLTAERWGRLADWIGVNPGTGNEPGSYGLGRGAFFTASRCNTVFYSSKAEDGYRFAGKSYLPSFEVDGEWRQGDGTYGYEGQRPVTELNLIPEYFRRSEQGTSIWILDYDTSGDVVDRMIRAALVYFWPAIKWGILEIKIGDTEINATNLREIMSKHYNAQDKNTYQNPNPLHFLDAYEAPAEGVITETTNILGKIEYYGKTSSDQPYSGMTAYLRDTGMIIYFTRKNTPIKFTGVFVCSDEKGSSILRKMENPTHTKWLPVYWKDSDRQILQTGKDAKLELDAFVEKAISKITTSGIEGRFDLSSVIGPGGNDINSNRATREENINLEELVSEETGIELGADTADVLAAVHTIKAVNVPRESTPRSDTPNPSGEVIVDGVEGDGQSDNPSLRFDPDGKGKNEGLIEIKKFDARCYMIGSGERITYRVIIRTEKKYAKKKIIVSLSAITEDGNAIHIVASSCKDSGKGGAKIKNGSIFVLLDSNGSCIFSVSVKESILVSPTVNIHIYQ